MLNIHNKRDIISYYLIWNNQSDRRSFGGPRADADGLDDRVQLEGGLHLAQRNVLAHLELDQILLAIDDLERAVGHGLKLIRT